MLPTQNKLFGNGNKATSHTVKFIKEENKILPACLEGNYRYGLGELTLEGIRGGGGGSI